MDYKYIIAELVAVRAHVERLLKECEAAEVGEKAVPPPAPTGQHAPAPEPSQIRDPLAKSMSDLVTPKQLGLIRGLGRERGVDWDAECLSVFKCKTEELSKRAASSFIDHLRAIEPGEHFRRAS